MSTHLLGFVAASIKPHIPITLEVELDSGFLTNEAPEAYTALSRFPAWASETDRKRSLQSLSSLVNTIAHSKVETGTYVIEVAQPSVLESTPWAHPEGTHTEPWNSRGCFFDESLDDVDYESAKDPFSVIEWTSIQMTFFTCAPTGVESSRGMSPISHCARACDT